MFKLFRAKVREEVKPKMYPIHIENVEVYTADYKYCDIARAIISINCVPSDREADVKLAFRYAFEIVGSEMRRDEILRNMDAFLKKVMKWVETRGGVPDIGIMALQVDWK